VKLPTKREINPYPGDLDGDYAEKNWFGISLEEGAKNIETNALHYGEDFTYMGPVAFAFYLQSAVIYANSESSREDSDFANCFIGLIESKLQDADERDHVKRAKIVCIELLSAFVSEYEKFDISEDIYGNLLNKAMKCHDQLQRT